MKRIIIITQFLIVSAIFLLSGCSHSPSMREVPQFGSNTAVWQPTDNTSQRPQHIALLLPLSGTYAPYAHAIRNGFFTAYYEAKNTLGYSPTITVLNTNGKNIKQVYQSAITQGATFIVGPLNKSNVATLATDTQATVPILALNTTPTNMTINNSALYEFGLSPTDEAQQAAVKARQDHHRHVIIIAPNSAWGHRLVNAFSTQWQHDGGSIVATQYYGNIASLSKNIANVLQITNDYKNEHKLKKLFREKMRYIPQRRQDFDSIFLVANPAMAQQIQPLLRFYFVYDIPIYATSAVYATHDRDLDGIQFCDMPWILAPNHLPSSLQTIQQRIQMLWPNRYAHYAKFYAMGVDAFHLASQLTYMQSHPQSGMPAATGTLYLTPQHYFYRQLAWAKMTNGQPQLIQ
ncbi:MAG: penicillin-binding protein activator [Gammaproteobacteria bacterium CG_4_10_14_0_8_um_filter_38_16]|nr:MAG: penicillin-binding protein activator [Gammaproteobacteria bacterium CG_4_10_14_0_8_um_filter_38_16]PJA03812.1 MAG: penicillin-binding protein activator [Gammaproteobacteria bacterium CG_4_10_14_0_2_um_filter_38_22]